ncbi:MAG: HDOD domain-containing protein [Betaproteobacteria bacterium]|nr:HDOD domain-containing protein [Betaproteobacteria bacterium]
MPVLRATLRGLAELKAREESITARDVSKVVLQDPLMALHVLRYSQSRITQRQLTEITTIERVLMMFGLGSFFRHCADLNAIEDVLAPYPVALQGALGVMSRADHAAHYALAIAGLRFDVEVDEIVIRALLHDLAELLLWATAPRLELQLEHMVRHMPGLRSATAQNLTLGFTLVELELALARAWNLPNLFLQLLDDDHADKPRVLSVTLSVALARHSAHGWYDAAIPHDIAHIEKLVTGQADQVSARIRWAAVQAARNWQTFGVRPALAWLHMLPGDWPAEEEDTPVLGKIQTQIAEQVIEQLAASDPRHCNSQSVTACLFFALSKGLGLRRLWWGEVNPLDERVDTKYALLADAWLIPNELSFGLKTRHLFAQVMQRQQGLWATKAARPKLLDLVPPPLSERLASRDFFAFAVHVKGAPAFFLFADAGRASRELDEARYGLFKRLSVAAWQALAHTVSPTTEAPLPVR